MTDLPANWERATIGELCNLINGRAFKPLDWSNEGLPIVRIQNLRDQTAPYNHFAGEVDGRHRISSGDLLFAWSGTPGTSFGAHIWGGGAAVLNQHIFRVDFDQTLLHPRYLQLALNVRLPELVGLAKGGAGLKHLTKSTVEAVPVPLPPLPEQERIVAVLQETVGRLTQVSDELMSQRDLAAVLEASLISQAVAVVPARSTWQRATIAELGEVRLGRQRSPEHHSGPNMRPYLRVANVLEDRIDISDVMTMNFNEKEAEMYGLRSGDILLNEGQSIDLVGRPAMYRDELPGACYTNTLIRFRASDLILPEFALLVFRHYLRTGRFRRIAKITTNLAHLGAKRFSELEVAFPSVREQRTIVDRCRAALATVTAVRSKIDNLLVESAFLRNGIEKKALDGSLTDQRSEEPKPIVGRPHIAAPATRARAVARSNGGLPVGERIIPIEQALRDAGTALEAKALFLAVGHPEGAAVAEVEQFYVALRSALQQKVIVKNRRSNADFFELAKGSRG